MDSHHYVISLSCVDKDKKKRHNPPHNPPQHNRFVKQQRVGKHSISNTTGPSSEYTRSMQSLQSQTRIQTHTGTVTHLRRLCAFFSGILTV